MESKRTLCPKCRSDQLSANKKGFGVGKAIAGAVVTGGVGLLAGFIGSRKIYVTCLACGHQWTLLTAEEERKAKVKREKRWEKRRKNPPSQIEPWLWLLLLVVLIVYGLKACLS